MFEEINDKNEAIGGKGISIPIFKSNHEHKAFKYGQSFRPILMINPENIVLVAIVTI